LKFIFSFGAYAEAPFTEVWLTQLILIFCLSSSVSKYLVWIKVDSISLPKCLLPECVKTRTYCCIYVCGWKVDLVSYGRLRCIDGFYAVARICYVN
jgi:hypothetical protein